MTSADTDVDFERAKLTLERDRFRAEIIRWLVLAVGAVVSFAVIDYGRLQLERFRTTAENERALLNAYLEASATVEPDLWLRKLDLIRTLSTNDRLRSWAAGEIIFVRQCAAKAAIYRETLRTGAALLDPHDRSDKRIAARRRFEELYWADLPYVRESSEVAAAMVKFRTALVAADSGSPGGELPDLNVAMIDLGRVLADSDPSLDPNCGRIVAAGTAGQ